MVFHLFAIFAKPTKVWKRFYTLVGFVNFRKSGKPVARGPSVVIILVDFAEIHLKRNAISTICGFCSRDFQVPDTEQGNSCLFCEATIGIICTERKK